MIETGEHALAATEERAPAEDEALSLPPAASSSPRRLIFWLQALAFLLGAALLVYVVNMVGIQPIFDALKQIGFGLFTLFALSGLRHVFRTLAMTTAVPPDLRRFSFLHAFSTRLGGEAVSFLTFTGPLLGEATKAALLKKRVPLVSGVHALVIDNLLYNLSVALFILSGACVMLFAYDLPEVARWTLIGIAVGAALGLAAVAWAASRRIMPLTWTVDWLARFGLKHKLVAARRQHVHHLESHVYDFYHNRRSSFAALIGWNFLAHAASVLEVYVILRMLGLDAQVQAAYVIESLTKVINVVFGFVPGTIGVYEGGTGLILHSLGYATAAGVTLGLVRKAAMVFWTGIGLCILAWRAIPTATRKLAENHPRLQKAMDSLVFSNIAHRPARTLVSVLGVALGVLLIVFTVGLANGILRERGRREASVGAEIMVRAAGTRGLSGGQPFGLQTERAAEIAQVAGVRAAVPVGQVTVGSDRGFGMRLLEGIPYEQYATMSGLRIVEGRGLAQSGEEAIVDTTWRAERQAQLGDTLMLYDRPFRIVGFYEPPGGGRIKIPLATMQDQHGSEGRASSILVACENPLEQDAVAARINERFPDQQIIFMRDLPELYAAGVPALNVFLSVVVSIAATISMLVILLAMYTTVTERTRQIGVLKSLGMSNAMIAWVIEKEALLVSVLGVICGLVLTLLARFAIMRATSLTVEIELRWVGIAFLIGIFGGTIGALYPALRAARQDPVQALSYE